MTEDQAIAWIETRYPDRLEALSRFVDLVRDEAARQNLISASTIDAIWARHVVDSTQLLNHVPPKTETWLDVGTGAGFPGMIVAILGDYKVTLAEPRKLRVDFLNACIAGLVLRNATVFSGKVQNLPGAPFDVISARAVMPLDKMFAATAHVLHANTRYILPRGERAVDDLQSAKRSWRGMFHVEHSVVGDGNGIVLAEKVKAK